MLVIQEFGMVDVGMFDMGSGSLGDRQELVDARPVLCGSSRDSRSRKASVTTRVIVSPVARAICYARRCASGSLMLRLIQSFRANPPLVYHSTSLSPVVYVANCDLRRASAGRGERAGLMASICAMREPDQKQRTVHALA